jgi:aminoglycoside/choline kinase family phosphotransferase
MRTQEEEDWVEQQKDLRQQQLEQWVSQYCGEALVGAPASSDASFRRYFRFQHQGETLIAMDAPPVTEDCRPFIQVAELFADAGVHVPKILAKDLTRGFLLLSDLGTDTYLDIIDEANADALFADAIAALITIQKSSVESVLPEYDDALLRRELELFPDWYLGRHLGLTVNNEWQTVLEPLFNKVIDQVLTQGKSFVHRDYMPRNLMASKPNPGVIDFQDAVYGPISYDPICLFKDAFLSWPEAKVEQWLEQYWQQAVDAGLPVPKDFKDFLYDCDVMGVHRHLKVIGIVSLRVFVIVMANLIIWKMYRDFSPISMKFPGAARRLSS